MMPCSMKLSILDQERMVLTITGDYATRLAAAG